MQKFYLDGVLLPVTPGQITIQIANKNKIISLANGEDYNLTEKAGLAELAFSFWLPSDPMSHLAISGFSPEELLRKLSDLKKKGEPFLFRVLNLERASDNSRYVTLEEYKLDENAENGGDILIEVTLKEWNPLKTVKLKVYGDKSKAVMQTIENTVNKALPKNQKIKAYKVKAGDTLSLIAKRYLGSSAKWRELYERNKEIINNPNKIKIGQVIKLEN